MANEEDEGSLLNNRAIVVRSGCVVVEERS
jgi:hypothetical protein